MTDHPTSQRAASTVGDLIDRMDEIAHILSEHRTVPRPADEVLARIEAVVLGTATLPSPANPVTHPALQTRLAV